MRSQPVAYSYRRWSSAEQSKGHSRQRQVEGIVADQSPEAWCKRNGVGLDTSLKADEGVSGFRGAHRAAENADRYALAGFLDKVKRGIVPHGSYLIVEALDRLSREDIVPAVNLFTGILLAGVRIVQLHPTEQVFTERADMTAVMLAILELSRGNSESRMKSLRNGAVWNEKRKDAAEKKRPMTGRLPFWLRVVDRRKVGNRIVGGRIVVDPERVKVVRRIFALSAEGRSIYAIVKTLNAEGVKHRKSHWITSHVAGLLGNRAVLGEFQAHTGQGRDRKPAGQPIEGYFPAVIDEQLFYTVRQGLDDRRRRKPGRAGREKTHLFSGLLVDARHQDASIVYTTAGNAGTRLVNSAALALLPGYEYVSFPACVFESAVLAALSEVTVGDVLPVDGGNLTGVWAGKLAEQEHLVARLKDRIRRDPDNDALFDLLAEAVAARKRLTEQLGAERQRTGSKSFAEAFGEVQTLAGVAKEADRDTRLRVRTALRRVIDQVHCLFVAKGRRRLAGVQVTFQSGRVRQYVINYRQADRHRPEAVWSVESWIEHEDLEVSGSYLDDLSGAKRWEGMLTERLQRSVI